MVISPLQIYKKSFTALSHIKRAKYGSLEQMLEVLSILVRLNDENTSSNVIEIPPLSSVKYSSTSLAVKLKPLSEPSCTARFIKLSRSVVASRLFLIHVSSWAIWLNCLTLSIDIRPLA